MKTTELQPYVIRRDGRVWDPFRQGRVAQAVHVPRTKNPWRDSGAYAAHYREQWTAGWDFEEASQQGRSWPRTRKAKVLAFIKVLFRSDEPRGSAALDCAAHLADREGIVLW